MKGIFLVFAFCSFSFHAKALSCNKEFFCEFYALNSDSGVVVQGYKISDIGTRGLTFRVLDSWGAFTVGDTITIWNDSLLIARDYACCSVPFAMFTKDNRSLITFTDTFLLMLKPHYAGSGYSSPGEFLFYQYTCADDILMVVNDSIEDIDFPSMMEPGPPGSFWVIEETVLNYKNRLVNNEGCTGILSTGLEQTYATSDVVVTLQNQSLYISNSRNLPVSQVNIYNITGQQVYFRSSNETSYDLSALAPAVYIAEVRYDGHVYRQKIVLMD